jgi:hypothetical protein
MTPSTPMSVKAAKVTRAAAIAAVGIACCATAIRQNGAPNPSVAAAPRPKEVDERCIVRDYLY